MTLREATLILQGDNKLTTADHRLGGNMNRASDVMIACLEQEGVEYVFGVPGEENLDFLDSLSR